MTMSPTIIELRYTLKGGVARRHWRETPFTIPSRGIGVVDCSRTVESSLMTVIMKTRGQTASACF